MQIQPVLSEPATGRRIKYNATATAMARTEQTSCRSERPKNMASLYSCISFGIFTSMFGHLLFENIFKLQSHKLFDDAVAHADSTDED